MRLAAKRSFVMLATVVCAAPAAAQQPGLLEPATRAWLGFGYDIRWIQNEGGCRTEVVVESLVQGAPAERAGLRPGDAILALDGSPVAMSRLPELAARLTPGDSIRLRVSRAGQVRELVAVADRRPARPPASAPTSAYSSYRTTAPIVELDGDVVVVRNLETTGRGDVRGYWVYEDDDRTEWRRLGTRSRDELDQRVRRLLVCADSLRWSAEPPAVAPFEMSRIQHRADSLRVLIARRALERQERDGQAVLRVIGPAAWTEGAPAPAPRIHALRVEDHLFAAERGVAGAEVTPLEPDLAAYFRGASEGLLVLRVSPGTPADRAGLRAGDVITDGEGRSLRSVNALRLLLDLPDAREVELRVVRHGRTRSLTIPRD